MILLNSNASKLFKADTTALFPPSIKVMSFSSKVVLEAIHYFFHRSKIIRTFNGFNIKVSCFTPSLKTTQAATGFTCILELSKHSICLGSTCIIQVLFAFVIEGENENAMTNFLPVCS
jgi:hypothetical protein